MPPGSSVVSDSCTRSDGHELIGGNVLLPVKRYLTFLFEPATGSVVEGSVVRQPDPRQPEGPQWKVIRNVGRIQIIARVDDQTTEIASAKWRDGLVSDFEQDGEHPTPTEWRALELALQEHVDPAAADPDPDPDPDPAPAPPPEPGRRYLTFLLDLSSPQDNKAIASTIRYAPDPAAPRPFVWKVLRDADDQVLVSALVGGKARPIATARWNGSGLRDKRQSDASEPNGNQWTWIERALLLAGITDAARASSCNVVEHMPTFTKRPSVPASDQATRSAPPAPVSNKRAAREFLTYMAVLGAATLAVVGLKRACSSSPPPASPPPAPPVVAVKPAPPPPSAPSVPEPPVELRVAQAATLAEAIALAKPAMADSASSLPDGAALLARYPKLRWSDVETPETTLAKVQKDSEVERGKRVCGEGEIDHILRRDVDRRKTYVGRLSLPDGDAIAFVAVGTTGELVKRMRAKFCGVVTGLAGTDVTAVGMFDLPENRLPQVEQ